jgi:flagellar protein FliS
MLLDGSIKFCRQAADALGRKDWEQMFNALVRAQKIVLELSTSLNHQVEPDLCDKLAALYTYIYRRLVDANMERDVAPVEECIRLLEYERETWAMLMKKLQAMRERGEDPVAETRAQLEQRNPVGRIGPQDAPAESPPPPSPGRSSFSVQG